MNIDRSQLQPTTTSPNDASKDEAILAGREKAGDIELEGRRGFFGLREQWSTVIIVWISILIVFNCALTLLVGFGKLDFRNYPTFITAVTVETFLQIVALGAIAVRFLFSKGDTPPSA